MDDIYIFFKYNLKFKILIKYLEEKIEILFVGNCLNLKTEL